MFDAQELEFLTAGTLEIDIADWRMHTEYRNGQWDLGCLLTHVHRVHTSLCVGIVHAHVLASTYMYMYVLCVHLHMYSHPPRLPSHPSCHSVVLAGSRDV